MPLGVLDARFLAQLTVLQGAATNIGQANQNAAQRLWMVPDLNGSTTNQSVPGLANAFSRVGIAGVYQQALTSVKGTAGDAMAMKLQSDYLAGQERAYRLSQIGPVRAGLHAAARRSAHGVTGNGVLGRVASHIQDLIVAGSAGYRPNGA